MRPRERPAVLGSGYSIELGQLALDLEQARAAIGLWQYAVLRIPAVGAVSTKLLDAVLASVAGWLDSLLVRTAHGDDKRVLAAFTREAMRCSEWAEEARLALLLIADIQTLDSRPS